MTATAKIFWSGRSQAVRLPKDFRFETKEVAISRDGNKVVLEPEVENAWEWLDRLQPMDADAVAAALERPGPEDLPDGPKFD